MAPQDLATDSLTLRQLMWTGTKDLHDVADDLFEHTLLKKKMSVATYKIYLSGIYYIYETLEEEMDKNKDHPMLAPIHFPQELDRSDAIECDLQHFYGESWKSEVQCIQSVQAYVHHIHCLADTRPELLIPHSYVRYFGDLSGGQIIKKIIARLHNISEDDGGLAFFDFNLANIKDFKDMYTSRLAGIDMSDALRDDMVQEARKVFQLNIDMLREIIQIADTSDDGYMKWQPEYKRSSVQQPQEVSSPVSGEQQEVSSSIPEVPRQRRCPLKDHIPLIQTSLVVVGSFLVVSALPLLKQMVNSL